VLQLLVTADVALSLPILVTLMMMVLTRATWHNIPEDSLLHNHHCENFKPYNCIEFQAQ
jgi:hypothetical protein